MVSRGFAHYFFICTELTQLCSFFGFPGLCMIGRVKRFTHRENYNSGLDIKATSLFTETNMYIIVTYLKLVLGVPLTHLHHLPAFMQVSSVESPAISARTGTRNRLEAPHLYR